MRVTFHKGLTHTVTVQNGFIGPYLNIELSPAYAYELLLALDAIRAELIDMTTNYHECSECGQTHANSVQGCPMLSHGEELGLPDFDTFLQEMDNDRPPEGSSFKLTQQKGNSYEQQ